MIGAFSTTLSAILSHPVQFQVLARSITSLVLSGDIRDFACGSQGGGDVRFVVVVSLLISAGDAKEEEGEAERDSREGREIL
jgi:Flp pilus assembly protein protease CpaA